MREGVEGWEGMFWEAGKSLWEVGPLSLELSVLEGMDQPTNHHPGAGLTSASSWAQVKCPINLTSVHSDVEKDLNPNPLTTALVQHPYLCNGDPTPHPAELLKGVNTNNNHYGLRATVFGSSHVFHMNDRVLHTAGAVSRPLNKRESRAKRGHLIYWKSVCR